MFGSNWNFSQEDRFLRKLEAVLDRRTEVDSLSTLISSISGESGSNCKIQNAALGFDSNIFLKLGGYRNNADVIDYIDTRHSGPLIMSGQVVQEFWNNHLAAIDTVSKSLQKKLNELKQSVEEFGEDIRVDLENIKEAIQKFDHEHGYIYKSSTLQGTLKVLEVFQRRAIFAYAPRTRFSEICHSRKRTKTPPGFKDKVDGDFFIWVDFLYGLLLAKSRGKQFDSVIFVTHDLKDDWSRGGVAHPILAAEVYRLLQIPFAIWTLEDLYKGTSS